MRVLRDGRGFDGLLVALALGYLLVFSAFPLVYNVIMSLQEVDLFSLASFDRPFVGLQNYRDVLGDPASMQILRNTVVFVVLSVACQLVIGFALALFFQLDFPGAGYLRGLFLAGWIMPALVVGAVWSWILAGDFGVLNHLLMSLGLTDEKIFWLSDPAVSLYAVILANIWLGVPFNMLLLSVGLAGIQDDVYEAAELDGATRMQRFFTITLPLMRAQLGAVIALGIIFTLQQFDLFAALSQGGPANASNVFQYWSWQLSFQDYQIGLGSAVSVLMIVFVVLVALIYVRSTRHEHADEPEHATLRLLLAIAIVLVAIYLFPLYWMYITALKNDAEIVRLPADLLAGSAEPAGRRGLDPAADALVHDELADHRARHHADRRLLRHRLRLCAGADPQPSGWTSALFIVLMMQVLPSSLMITPIFVAFNQVGLIEYPRLAVILAQAAKMLPLYIVLVPRHLPAGAARARGGGAGRRQLARRRVPADQRAAGAQRHPGQLDPGPPAVVRRVRLCPVADRRAGDAAGDASGCSRSWGRTPATGPG